MKAQAIILGNVITMDAYKPYAEAIAVADEKIIYVGSKEAATPPASMMDLTG